MEILKSLCLFLCLVLVKANLRASPIIHNMENDVEIGSTATPSQWCNDFNLTKLTRNEMILNDLHSCCDQHYACGQKDFIAQGEKTHGITNTMEATATSCDCNSGFVKCLKAMDTKSAQALYLFYILEVEKCFLHAPLIQECLKRDKGNRCTMYAFKDGPRRHQFFDQYYTQGADDGIMTTDEVNMQQRSVQYPFIHFQQQPMIPYPLPLWPHY